MIPAFLLPAINWLLGPFAAFAKGAGSLLLSALKNPYVLGALVAGAFFWLWNVEEAGKARINADGLKAVAGYQADLKTVLGANATLVQSLTWQTGRVKALAAASAQKTLAAQKAQGAAQRATDAASAVAAHVEAFRPPKGSSDADAALAILKGRAD